jgi:hypothetical protein
MGANAVTTVPVYTAGEVLTAADMNITNSGIPVFATTVTRDAAFGGAGEKTLAEGQFAYIEASDQTQYYSGSSWLTLGGKIGQVVSATRSTLFQSSSTSYVDITTMTASITLSSTASKVLVFFSTSGVGANGTADVLCRIVRDATAIADPVLVSGVIPAGNETRPAAVFYVDSPASVSALTYKMQGRTTSSAFSIGGRYDGTYTGVSSFMIMEILA